MRSDAPIAIPHGLVREEIGSHDNHRKPVTMIPHLAHLRTKYVRDVKISTQTFAHTGTPTKCADASARGLRERDGKQRATEQHLRVPLDAFR